MNFGNFSDMAGFAGAGWHRTSIRKREADGLTETTVYSGKTSRRSPEDGIEGERCWLIRRTVIVEDADGNSEVEEKYAYGADGRVGHGHAWSDRESLDYKFLAD